MRTIPLMFQQNYDHEREHLHGTPARQFFSLLCRGLAPTFMSLPPPSLPFPCHNHDRHLGATGSLSFLPLNAFARGEGPCSKFRISRVPDLEHPYFK